jgi:hydroxymethylbilane synthase
MTTPFRIGTRGSRLALWQANHIAERLRPLLSPRPVELVEIRTTGDQVRDASLTVIGGQGVFTKEIQQAVLDHRADLAVHSLKDLPTEPVSGLSLAAVPQRGPTGDVLVSQRYSSFDALPPGARVATGSSRRRAQLLHRRSDLQLVDIRGNVETRLRKLREQELDGLVLAEAGLERLALRQEITEILDPSWMLPAVGQGALGLECRMDDMDTLAIVRQLNHVPTMQAVLAERAFLRTLGGGCLLPIASLGRVEQDNLTLRGVVCSPDGRQRLADSVTGHADVAEQLGQELADRLLQQGARQLLPANAPLGKP